VGVTVSSSLSVGVLSGLSAVPVSVSSVGVSVSFLPVSVGVEAGSVTLSVSTDCVPTDWGLTTKTISYSPAEGLSTPLYVTTSWSPSEDVAPAEADVQRLAVVGGAAAAEVLGHVRGPAVGPVDLQRLDVALVDVRDVAVPVRDLVVDVQPRKHPVVEVWADGVPHRVSRFGVGRGP
jgi:hypothetical protein